MDEYLFAWVGAADLKASRGESGKELGPTGQAVKSRSFDEIHLLVNYPKAEAAVYEKWIKKQTRASVHMNHCPLTKPTNLGEIYEAVTQVLHRAHQGAEGRDYKRFFHTSPGTPQMAIVWMIMANSRFPAELLESSREHGVNTLPCPFELSVNYLSNVSAETEREIIDLSQGLPPVGPEFDAIVHRSPEMKRLLAKARRVAITDFPVLITGESGTGKELLARAIHSASPRQQGEFIAVNCGAIPSELMEAEFFGYEKGAFTGAVIGRAGHLAAASGGTLFLDEIGELPKPMQVKLLRALQEKRVRRVGSSKEEPVDARIVAATNRDLVMEIERDRFREDLFHRIAVGILHLPALRERKSDLDLLIDHILTRLNDDCQKFPGWKHKSLSAGARILLHQHRWPGNVRELINTLARASLWSPRESIAAAEIRDALLHKIGAESAEGPAGIFDLPLGEGLNLPELIRQVACHYLDRAMQESGGNKTRAAEMVGLPSYQTFTNWYNRYMKKARRKA